MKKILLFLCLSGLAHAGTFDRLMKASVKPLIIRIHRAPFKDKLIAVRIPGPGGSSPVGSSSINTTPIQTKDLSQTNTGAYTSSVGTGHLLIAFISSDNEATLTTGCSDDVNGAWTEAPNSPSQASFGGNMAIAVFYFQNSGSGTTTVTCAQSGSTNVEGLLLEYEGASTTAAFDDDAISNDSNDVGPITTSLTNELILVGNVGNTAPSACTGYTQIAQISLDATGNVMTMDAATATNYTANCDGTAMFLTARWIGAFK